MERLRRQPAQTQLRLAEKTRNLDENCGCDPLVPDEERPAYESPNVCPEHDQRQEQEQHRDERTAPLVPVTTRPAEAAPVEQSETDRGLVDWESLDTSAWMTRFISSTEPDDEPDRCKPVGLSPVRKVAAVHNEDVEVCTLDEWTLGLLVGGLRYEMPTPYVPKLVAGLITAAKARRGVFSTLVDVEESYQEPLRVHGGVDDESGRVLVHVGVEGEVPSVLDAVGTLRFASAIAAQYLGTLGFFDDEVGSLFAFLIAAATGIHSLLTQAREEDL